MGDGVVGEKRRRLPVRSSADRLASQPIEVESLLQAFILSRIRTSSKCFCIKTL